MSRTRRGQSVIRAVELFIASLLGAFASRIIEPAWAMQGLPALLYSFVAVPILFAYCAIGVLVILLMEKMADRAERSSGQA